ncbi:tetratricopeptide repeat protein [Paraburkholderia unamae]|uniref:tetratricopeptide repeat protein n=1 Tax=Paraburkholderia unamae TaxID=219649 RepID=UPI000DD401BA|nr:tetratricopeptide repeat protein [Paraburkholderia unamae]
MKTLLTHRASPLDTLLNDAISHFSHGQPREALAKVTKALKLQPGNVAALNIAGACSQRLGKLKDAEAYWRRALKEDPDYADAHNNLGNLFVQSKRLSEAEAAWRRALKIRPDHADAHNNLGNLLKQTQRLPEAEAAWRRALEIRPDHADAHNNLGNLLYETKRFPEAEAAWRRALAIRPDHANAHNNLGNLLKQAKRFSEAEAAYLHALAIQPDHADARNNLGNLLKQLRRFSEAEAVFRQALEIRPDHAEACYNLGALLLHTGRLSEGWPLHEARYHEAMPERIVKPSLACPQWQGESLENRSILVHGEQGFGDQIQFVRYLARLKELGASRVTLICSPALQPLFEGIAGADVVLTTDEVAKAPSHDYWTFLLSLPLRLATTLDSIPAGIPYLRAAPDRLSAWSPRLPAAQRRIGLVWAGNAAQNNDANRSLPGLATLAPLWDVPGVHFVSLQKGQREEEAVAPQSGQSLTHLGGDIEDFADSAAIVAQLDLVICVDTAIAHLAGALGTPCWVLLPSVNAGWRWLDERTDSPWYPGAMRLFRQRHLDDWAPTLLEVAQSLRRFCHGGPLD